MTDDLSYYQHGDEPDAANFAAAAAIVGQLSDRTGRAGYIVHGFELTPDLNNLEVNIGGGTALILRKDYTTVSPNIDPSRTYTWTAHPVHKEGVTQLGLEDNAVNHIFLDVNVSTRDTPLTFLNQSGDYPSDESIKIGEIDTNEDTVNAATSEQWHLVTVDGSLTYPDKDAAVESASDLPDGTSVFDRKDGVFWRVESGGLEPFVDTGEIATDAITVDELDQSIAPTWTSQHTFGAGLDVGDDLVSDGTVIWDDAGGHLNQAVLENDGLTLSPGNALTGGGLISLGGSATLGVAADAIAAAELDLSITPTWTGEHTFTGGVTGLPAPAVSSDAARKQEVDDHEASTSGVHGVGSSNVESVDGAQSKADTAQANAESFAASEVDDHKQNEVHDQPQPNQAHGNEDHNETYETETGAQSRVDSHESDTTGVHGVGASSVESTAGAQSKADTAQSNAESFAAGEVDAHKQNEVHDQPQPNQSHGNEDHNESYTTAGDDVENFSTSGAANTVPVSQGDGTLSMQNVSQAIEFLDVASPDDLPDPGSVSKPTIAYVDSEDDYVGVFKQ